MVPKALDIPAQAAEFIVARRVGRLATADPEAAPHVVPVCYAFDGRRIYSALDRKPKRVAQRQLKRVRNILANPRVALVIDDYAEDWSLLAYVLVEGEAHLLEDGEERDGAEAMLREKYPQYREALPEGCPIIGIIPDKVVTWGRV